MEPGPDGISAIGKLFSKDDGCYVLHGLIYIIYKVYIDDLLMNARTEEEFLRNVEMITRVRSVILNPKKVYLGLTIISFLGHEVDSEGI